VNDNYKGESRSAENQPLNAALAQMSEVEVVRLLNLIDGLQHDLLRLIPLFKGEEPVEAVTYTQDLLNILSDKIEQFLAAKQANVIRDHWRNPDNEEMRIDYAPVHHLLSKFHNGKRRLVWADA
jgi:hypothetical protein